jgi:hypothetical protein
MVKFFLYSIYNNNKERMDYEEVIEEVVNIKPEKRKKVKSKSPDDNINDDPSYWKLILLRNTRNSYLALTDKYLLPDYPITEEKRNIIIEYRQYLRNFINNDKDTIMNGIEVEIQPLPSHNTDDIRNETLIFLFSYI